THRDQAIASPPPCPRLYWNVFVASVSFSWQTLSSTSPFTAERCARSHCASTRRNFFSESLSDSCTCGASASFSIVMSLTLAQASDIGRTRSNVYTLVRWISFPLAQQRPFPKRGRWPAHTVQASGEARMGQAIYNAYRNRELVNARDLTNYCSNTGQNCHSCR